MILNNIISIQFIKIIIHIAAFFVDGRAFKMLEHLLFFFGFGIHMMELELFNVHLDILFQFFVLFRNIFNMGSIHVFNLVILVSPSFYFTLPVILVVPHMLQEPDLPPWHEVNLPNNRIRNRG